MDTLEPIYNPIALARPQRHRACMASSFDRRGGNHDWSNYIRTRGDEAVLLETEGPGCITRIWTADPRDARVRIFVDSTREPVLSIALFDLFRTLPLSFGVGGESSANHERSRTSRLPMGHTSYCPIPFEHGCVITITPPDDYLYYQINYSMFPRDTKLKSFDPDADMDTQPIRLAAKAWSDWERGKPVVAMERAARRSFDVPAGGQEALFSHEGAGVVRGMRITLRLPREPAEASHVLDNVWVVAHFDDDEPRDPSIRAPIGPLHMRFGQERPAKSLLVGAEPSGEHYCFFPMPFAERASISIVNRSVLPLKGAEAAVLAEPPRGATQDMLRFRATWHSETPFGPDHRDYDGVACRLLNVDGRNNYEILAARGAGHFAGCAFHADLRDAPTDRAACEGDEMFFVDDDPGCSINGTGTEDYLNDAWGMRGYCGPISGDDVARAFGDGPQLFGYRLHLSDSIPFRHTGRFTLEHGTGNNCSGLYRSVAYWYMHPSAANTKREETWWQQTRR